MCLQSLKCLLFGSLLKKFADPWGTVANQMNSKSSPNLLMEPHFSSRQQGA